MKLLSSALSPYVRKVHVLLHEAGQTDRVEIVPVVNTPSETAAELRPANPLGKIPALIRDTGPAIHDSRVITRYLDDLLGAGLYPASRIWEVLTLEATADGMMDALLLMTYETRLRPPEGVSDEWVAAQWSKVARSLDALENRWMGHLAGPLDMGQIGLGCALGYLDFRHGARNWREGHDALAGWYADIAARPSMQATAPAA